MEYFIFVNDLLAPQHEIIREFVGYHPSRVLKEFPDIIRNAFRLKGSKFFEDKLKWDVAADPIDFFGQWRGKLGKDSFTTGWVQVRCLGKMAAATKMGHVTVWITGTMETKLPYNNIFDEGWKYLYLKLLYEQQIKNYLIEEKGRVLELDNQIRALFDVMKAETEGERRTSK